jgi:ATP-dependent Clp protease adaptor protein ClpS
MSTQNEIEIDVVIDEKINKETASPKKYHVILMNDNKTPINWVIDILVELFRHSEAVAQDLTLKIHNEGSAIVGTYYYEIAEQKLYETIKLSRDQGFPLMAKLEEE